jgi:predicted transcriptional regulator
MKSLTQAESEIMQILWKRKKGFVKDILENYSDAKPAYNTVSTIIRILEKKGFINHITYGKTYEYYPIISKEEYRTAITGNLVTDYFNDSPFQLVSFFAKDRKITIKDVEELKKIINDIEINEGY